MEQAIADGVGDGGVAEVVMPVPDGDLAGEDRGPVAVAVVDDLEQIAALEVGQGRESPVVEDEHVGAGQAGEQSRVGPIGAGECELVEQARDAAVEGPVALATGLLRERAGKVGLPDTGGPGDDHVVMLLDPGAGRELAHEGAVQLTAGRVVDVLDTGVAEA